MVITGLLKEKKKIIIYQTMEVTLAGIAYLILGSYAGAIDSAIGCTRNILCYKEKLNVFTKGIIIALYTILTLIFNNMGWAGVVLWFGSVLYIAFIDLKNVEKFKYVIIANMLAWTIHDFCAQSYVAVAFDIGTIVTNIISILKIHSDRAKLMASPKDTKQTNGRIKKVS
jgi:hypothetical protein